jgi:uncharacterized membrane protein YebE (DUF533 family)
VTESYDAAYYAELESRVKELVRSVEDWFPADQIAQLVELAEHNEPAVAVEMLSEMIVERDAPVERALVDELHSLAQTMRLEPDVSDRLRPLVEEG